MSSTLSSAVEVLPNTVAATVPGVPVGLVVTAELTVVEVTVTVLTGAGGSLLDDGAGRMLDVVGSSPPVVVGFKKTNAVTAMTATTTTATMAASTRPATGPAAELVGCLTALAGGIPGLAGGIAGLAGGIAGLGGCTPGLDGGTSGLDGSIARLHGCVERFAPQLTQKGESPPDWPQVAQIVISMSSAIAIDRGHGH